MEPISPSAKTTSDASNDESRKDDATNTIDVLSEIKSIIASLHNASLLIDDIEDNSKLRRGNPVAHSIFGMANCINCANYVYFLALEKVEGLGNEVALKVLVIVRMLFCINHMNIMLLTCFTFMSSYSKYVHLQKRCLYRKCSIFIEDKAMTSTLVIPPSSPLNPNTFPW